MWTYFFYGTLMDPDIAGAVFGRPLAGFAPRPAVLEGYGAYYLNGQSFPMVRPEPGAETPGLVVHGVTGPEAVRLDRYEGPDYFWRLMPVTLSGGEVRAARVFLPRRPGRLSSRRWDLGRWQRTEKTPYLRALLKAGI